MVLAIFSQKNNRQHKISKGAKVGTSGNDDEPDYEPAEVVVLDQDSLKQYLQREQYGLIVGHPEKFNNHPDAKRIYQEAVRAIDENFALVPEGFVSLAQTVNDHPGCPETDIETNPFLLARCCVTNEQFQKFVDDGGYDNLNLWPQEIWPHLIDFKDLTGQTGPRYWRNGRHDKRLAHHPVVGICCHEASAYVHWAGYRLPTEAEWQMATSWRIRSSSHLLRRYPWGDAMDKRCCNIWISEVGRTTPVDDYPSGAAPNGLLQLIGNVWEWTSTDFEIVDDESRPVIGDMLMKSIRGGAFDTYFSNQATSYFRTGSACITRAHNIGFRCAMDIIKRDGKGGDDT